MRDHLFFSGLSKMLGAQFPRCGGGLRSISIWQEWKGALSSSLGVAGVDGIGAPLPNVFFSVTYSFN